MTLDDETDWNMFADAFDDVSIPNLAEVIRDFPRILNDLDEIIKRNENSNRNITIYNTGEYKIIEPTFRVTFSSGVIGRLRILFRFKPDSILINTVCKRLGLKLEYFDEKLIIFNTFKKEK